MVSKVWNWNSTSVKLNCEINFFLSVENLTLTKVDWLLITQRLKMIKIYYKNSNSATGTYRALRKDYGLHNCPNTQAIRKILKKFEKTDGTYRCDIPPNMCQKMVENYLKKNQCLQQVAWR